MKTKEKIQGFRHCRAFSCLLLALAFLGCISCSRGEGIEPYFDDIFLPVPGEVSCDDPPQTSGFLTGDGTRARPFLICTYEQFNLIRDDMTAHYAFAQDIDARPSWSEHGSAPCTPFNGNSVASTNPCDGFWGFSGNFSGGLDGRGYALRNLYSNRVPPIVANFSGIIFQDVIENGAYIRNLGIIDPRVRFGTGGGILGRRLEGSLQNSYIVTQSGVAGFAGREFALFLGQLYQGSISNSFTDFESLGPVPADAGFVFRFDGTNSTRGTAENCYARGIITIDVFGQNAGGIAKSNYSANVRNLYATVTMSLANSAITPTSGALFQERSSGPPPPINSIAGTNYFVDDWGGADGVYTGSCDVGATCVRGTTGTATSDADALAEIRALSVLPTDWSR